MIKKRPFSKISTRQPLNIIPKSSSTQNLVCEDLSLAGCVPKFSDNVKLWDTLAYNNNRYGNRYSMEQSENENRLVHLFKFTKGRMIDIKKQLIIQYLNTE